MTARVVEDAYGDRGKVRPVLLIEAGPWPGWWYAMGFTRQPAHTDGNPRIPIPQPELLGLRGGGGYLWSPRPTPVPVGAVTAHVGWATDEMVDVVVAAMGRSGWELEGMRPHARADRRRVRRRVA